MANPSKIFGSRILIVDDQQANAQVLEVLLQRAGYLYVTSTLDPKAVCALHLEHGFDLILLDLLMPDMDGFQVMEALHRMEPDRAPSIFVITAQPEHKLRAMQQGAKDFISKPFDHAEVLIRVHYVLEARLLDREARNCGARLEKAVLERTAELRRSEEMFRELAANIPEALWIRDIDRQTVEFVNPAWSKLSGLQVAPGTPLEAVRPAIHPDDLIWISHERRKTPSAQPSNEYRIVRPDGTVRWVQARSFPIANPSGKAPWIVEIIEDVTLRREAQRQLVHLARHDPLTGLANRTFLYESLGEALARAQADTAVVSLLLLDIDHFKNVNDTLGHIAGDALLREFAARLIACVRPGDTVGRLGGDEFAMVVTTPADTFGVPFVAARIRDALRTPLALDGHELLVTASIGIAGYPADAPDSETLVRCADAALYDAKAAGRNTSRCYSPEMTARALKKTDIESALRAAHDRGEFVLHYQPKLGVEKGELTGVEALIRWNRPGHGLVLPGQFVPALEEMGLIVPVGAWVVDTACRQIRAWSQAGLGDIQVAVNVSSRQMREEGFVVQVTDTMRSHRVDPRFLEFEIAEGTFMAHGESADASLRKLKSLGASISIDDFGTGYSNLAYLQRFQVDALKIDIVFIRDVMSNPDAAAITIAIINMAHSLRLKVVAEGVETVEQLEFLRLHGCDEVQGYFLSLPLSAEALSTWLRERLVHDARAGLPPRGDRQGAMHG